MRQGQQNRRGRGRSNSNNNNNNNNNNNGRKPQNPLSRNYESSGPDVKIRGTAAQIAEKYMTLARDASSSGDIITSENYLQHAEHYNRIIMAAQAQAQMQSQPQPSMMGHQSYDSPQPVLAPQRVHADGNGSYREQAQPQPQIAPLVIPLEQPVIPSSVPAEAPVQAAPSSKEPDAGRRRRRRYPANGAERAAGASEPVSNGLARGEIAASGQPTTDEALA